MALILILPILLGMLALVVFAFWQPVVAFMIFFVLAVLFELMAWFEDRRGRPAMIEVTPSMYSCRHPWFQGIWTETEAQLIRNYHLFLRITFGAKMACTIINSARWMSVLLWLLLMLYKQLWIPSGLLVVNFFVAGPLTVRLDPIIFLASSVAHRPEAELISRLLQRLTDPDRWKHEDEEEDEVATGFD